MVVSITIFHLFFLIITIFYLDHFPFLSAKSKNFSTPRLKTFQCCTLHTLVFVIVYYWPWFYFLAVLTNISDLLLLLFNLYLHILFFMFSLLIIRAKSLSLTVIQCQPLVKKMISRIENWSSKLLSYAGRLQLIKSVLFGVQTYWSQVFALPQKSTQINSNYV